LIPDLPRMAEEDSSSSLLAAASALGEGTTLSRPAFSTLIDVLGTEAGGDPRSTLPKRLQEVSGSTPVAALVLTVARFILELTELEEIHPKSWERANANPSMAVFTAKAIYNKAFESVPASEHPNMKGPEDQSKNKQVKDYKGLTAACEEEVHNTLCLVAPVLLRAVATARFATAPAASTNSPGSGVVFNPEVLVAVSRSVGEALGP
jgi:hypothetical protein